MHEKKVLSHVNQIFFLHACELEEQISKAFVVLKYYIL